MTSVRIDDVEVQPLAAGDERAYATLDLAYRTLCAMLYNYAPMSGHPGGSISSGRFVAALLFDAMAYDLAQPKRNDADVISYAAGHKALGLYAMWALRNEIARLAAPELLPSSIHDQLRFEDLLGFRRNPTSDTPLFREFESKALDGHPTPATPFVRLATGASGVGMGSSLGLALALSDWFGDSAPRVHIVEGEGGLTPGRVAEALAFASLLVEGIPGLAKTTAIKALVDAVRPKPINVLVVRDSGLSVADIAALGVRRISVGPALALAAWTGFTRAAQMLKSEGSFAGLASLVPYGDLNELFTTDYRARQADGLRSAGHQEYNGATERLRF